MLTLFITYLVVSGILGVGGAYSVAHLIAMGEWPWESWR